MDFHLLLLLTACGGEAAPEADSAGPTDPLATYDADDDGVLEVEDLRDGQVVLLLEGDAVDGRAAWGSTDARIEPVADASWVVRADFAAGQGATAPSADTALVLRFRNGATLTERSGDLEYLSLAPADRDVLFRADAPGGTVEVSFVGADRASGRLVDAEPELRALDLATGEETGETIAVRAAAFRTLPVVTARRRPAPGPAR